MPIPTATDQDLKVAIKPEGITMIDFTSPYCPPCKTLLPILEQLDVELNHRIAIWQINVDESPLAASELGIMGTPTVVIYQNGQPVEKLTGLRPKQVYVNILSRYL